MLLPLGGQAQDMQPAPNPTETCLTPAPAERGLPQYPELHLLRNAGHLVRVTLSFTEPDQPPQVTLDNPQVGDKALFDEAVRAHVKGWRVPCLRPGDPPARLVLEFSFSPDNRAVFSGQPKDPDRQRRAELLSCQVHQDKGSTPKYPLLARQHGVHGSVLAQLRFTAPDQPPEFKLLHRPRARLLALAVQDWLQGLRLPCLRDEPLDAEVDFQFQFDGEAAGFKRDLGFVELLGLLKGLDRQRVVFDTSTMACPFDVQLTYWQPLAPNGVDSVGSWHPARAELLHWLRGFEIEAPSQTLDMLFGKSATFTVPCVKIDHHPKE
jgi:hypothetical protein